MRASEKDLPALSNFQNNYAHFCGVLRKAELDEAWKFFQVEQNRQIETIMMEFIMVLNMLAYLKYYIQSWIPTDLRMGVNYDAYVNEF